MWLQWKTDAGQDRLVAAYRGRLVYSGLLLWAPALATLWAGLENRFKPLVPDDIEQGQRRTFGLFGPALQLRDIPNSEIEVTGKHRLTQIREIAPVSWATCPGEAMTQSLMPLPTIR
jgi:hypothetical protein